MNEAPNKTQDELYAEILQLKNDLERLKSALNDNNKILDSLGHGIFIVDPKANISYANPSALSLLGWDVSEVSGKRWFEIVKIVDEKNNLVDIEQNPINITLSQHRILQDRYYFLKKDQSILPVDIVTSPVFSEGKITAVCITFLDATTENAKDVAKTEFISTASHHLRTPLSTLKWYFEILKKGYSGQLTPEQNKYLDEMSLANKKMINFINALFNVSRVELGKFEIDPQLVDIKDVLENVIDKHKTQIEKKSINLVKNFDKNILPIRVDVNLLTVAISYLLDNAIKYTPDQGSIAVLLENDMNEKESNILIKVKDTGIGIPQNEQEKIFSKLFRASNAELNKIDGNGLDLFIVKSILTDANCGISFKSEENNGTEFIVKIPSTGMQKRTGDKDFLITELV
jgi:PAS domain S-box-containing protein